MTRALAAKHVTTARAIWIVLKTENATRAFASATWASVDEAVKPRAVRLCACTAVASTAHAAVKSNGRAWHVPSPDARMIVLETELAFLESAFVIRALEMIAIHPTAPTIARVTGHATNILEHAIALTAGRCRIVLRFHAHMTAQDEDCVQTGRACVTKGLMEWTVAALLVQVIARVMASAITPPVCVSVTWYRLAITSSSPTAPLSHVCITVTFKENA